jgi:hypothetical protein
MVKGGRNRGAPTSHRRVDGEGGKKKDSLGKSRQRASLPRSAAAASIGGGMTFLYYLYCSRYFTSFVCFLFFLFCNFVYVIVNDPKLAIANLFIP